MPIPAAPLHAPAPSARSPIRRALAALTLTTAVVAAACGSSKASTSRDSNAVEKPDLTVAVVPAISAAGLYIAQQRGYFTAAGLHVKIVPVASGVDAIPNLASGSVDIDEGQWAADLSAEAAGAVRLYALAAASAGGPGVQEVVVPAGSPVTTVAQLHGKTIAVNALGGLAVLLTDNVLADHGVPVKDVHYVPVPFPAMGAALAAHRVDAAFIAEPSLSAAEIGWGGAAVRRQPGRRAELPHLRVRRHPGMDGQIPADRRRVRGRAGTGPAGGRDRPGRRGARADPRFAHQQDHGGGDGAGHVPAVGVARSRCSGSRT